MRRPPRGTPSRVAIVRACRVTKAAISRARPVPFVRAWRLYLTGSIAAFLTGKLQLFQVLYARSGAKNVPWTRAHVYAGHP